MFNNLSIEEAVDRLKEVRDNQKILKAQEDELKKMILADGRKEIKSENHTCKIQTRKREVFNEDAFIETFKNDKNYGDDIKEQVLETKLVLNTMGLQKCCEDKIIPINYLEPFNTITESEVITVK